MAEKHHIEQICDTRANLQANLDPMQIAIESNNAENLVYCDDDGSYHIVANLNEAATFGALTCDTLTITTGSTFVITDLTEGAVLFGGSSGLILYDATNIFWDNSSKRLGIGTNAPDVAIHAYGGSSGADPISGTILALENERSCILQLLTSGGENTDEASIYFGVGANNSHFIKALSNGSVFSVNAKSTGKLQLLVGSTNWFDADADVLNIGDGVYVDASTNHVGIGTDDKTDALNVNGDISMLTGAARKVYIQGSGGENLTIQAADAVAESTGGDLLLLAGGVGGTGDEGDTILQGLTMRFKVGGTQYGVVDTRGFAPDGGGTIQMRVATTAPNTPTAGQLWLDTTGPGGSYGSLKIYTSGGWKLVVIVQD